MNQKEEIALIKETFQKFLPKDFIRDNCHYFNDKRKYDRRLIFKSYAWGENYSAVWAKTLRSIKRKGVTGWSKWDGDSVIWSIRRVHGIVKNCEL